MREHIVSQVGSISVSIVELLTKTYTPLLLKNLKSAEAKHLPDSLMGVIVLNGMTPNGRLLLTV